MYDLRCSGIFPKRVVITNGDWVIAILDPLNAFSDAVIDPNRILVFFDFNDVEKRSRELFLNLEYQQVLGEAPPLTPGEIEFHVSAQDIDRAMHGLRLRYIEQEDFYRASPVIVIAPVLFIHSRQGTWLRVETPPTTYQLSHEEDRLQQHLNDVQGAARQLLSDVNRRLGTSLEPFSVSSHYADDDGFEALRGIIDCTKNEYVIVTGESTHYILSQPSVSNCPYHDWVACRLAGIAADPVPIVAQSILPRSFFVSEELHHCAHRDVAFSKAMPLTDINRSRCGPRSGQDGQAFCEIWRFEQYLCCRSCVFQEVCTMTPIFQLPCHQ